MRDEIKGKKKLHFLSTKSSSASLAIVLLENDVAFLPTILDGRLTGLPVPLEPENRLGFVGPGLVFIVVLFKFCTRLWTFPERGRAGRVPLGMRLAPLD